MLTPKISAIISVLINKHKFGVILQPQRQNHRGIFLPPLDFLVM